MENYFQMNFTPQQVNAISNLGLAHVGDGVYELQCRSYLPSSFFLLQAASTASMAAADTNVRNLRRKPILKLLQLKTACRLSTVKGSKNRFA